MRRPRRAAARSAASFIRSRTLDLAAFEMLAADVRQLARERNRWRDRGQETGSLFGGGVDDLLAGSASVDFINQTRG